MRKGVLELEPLIPLFFVIFCTAAIVTILFLTVACAKYKKNSYLKIVDCSVMLRLQQIDITEHANRIVALERKQRV